MATKTQIGAVISIEGAKEYNQAISNIVRVTREMESELKLAETSFQKEYKTIKDVTLVADKHKQVIDEYKNKLKEQLEAQNAMNLERERAIRKAEELKRQINLLSVSGEEHAEELKQTQKEYEKNAEHINKLNKGIIDMATDINETNTQINEHKNALRDLPSNYKLLKEAVSNATSEMGEFLKGVGDAMTKYITLPMMALGTVSVKAFADWESAFIGVKKTVEGTPEQLEAIAQGITDISLSTASSRESVAAVAEAAGQLGIATDDVVGFTKVMVMLGDTTNLSADEAAIALARVINITGESTDNIERIGSAIVHLGNNFATSESEIVAMTNRLAAGGTIAGLTTTEILGLATAMSSVGITAEAGGTAMTQTLTAIEKEFAAFTNKAENNLDKIAEISGMSAEAFADAWQNRPAEAVQAFISGLGSLDEKGESATLVLDELGMSGIRQSNMLKSLALASETLGDAMTKASQGYAMVNENGEAFNALAEEAEKRYQSFDTQVNQLKESFKLLGSAMGEDLAQLILPVIDSLTNGLRNLADWWSNLGEVAKASILVISGIVMAAGPLLTLVGGGLIAFAKLKAAMKVFDLTWKALMIGVGQGVLIAAGVVAAIAAIIAIIKNWESISAWFKEKWESISEAIQFTWYALGEACKSAWDLIKQTVSSVVESVKTWVTDKFTTMKDNAIQIFENLKSAISTKIANVRTAIVNGLTQAINWIKDLPRQALQWGKDIIANLVSGIQSKISAVTDAISGIADRIRSFLGFSEPEKGALSNFHTFMPDMMKLMAQGINDNAYLVEDALANVTGMMSGEMGGQSVNYGGVVINLNVPEGANGRMLVDEIETELANRTIRRRAVFS